MPSATPARWVIPTIELSENPVLAELVARGVEDLAQGPFAARRARRLAVAGSAQLQIVAHPGPHSIALPF